MSSLHALLACVFVSLTSLGVAATSADLPSAAPTVFLNQVQVSLEVQMPFGYAGHLRTAENIDGEIIEKDLRVWVRRSPRAVEFQMNSPAEGLVLTWQESWRYGWVNPVGLVPAFPLDPTGDRAMENSLRPITEFGLDLWAPQFLALLDSLPPDARVELSGPTEETLDGQLLRRWEIVFPPAGEWNLVSVNLWLDPVTNLPIRFESRRDSGALHERYHYLELTLNPTFEANRFD